MSGTNHSAQALTIRLLQMLGTLERQAVFQQAFLLLQDNSEAQELLRLCVMMAGELKARPEKYNSFESLSRAILARQKKEVSASLDDPDTDTNAVKKKDVGQALKFKEASANKYISRINDHTRELKVEEIQNLLAGFRNNSNRIFWKNQIYCLFPELSAQLDFLESSVLDCLRAVWNCLTVQEQDNAYDTFLSDRAWFDQLKQNTPEPPAEEDTQEDKGLFGFLDKYIDAQKDRYDRGIKSEIYNRLYIDPDTYLAYKRLWKKYEDHKGSLPRRRLSREQLLFLALFLNMDFPATALLLAKAGYAFHYEKADILVTKYLLRKIGNKQEIMDFLVPPRDEDS